MAEDDFDGVKGTIEVMRHAIQNKYNRARIKRGLRHISALQASNLQGGCMYAPQGPPAVFSSV